MCKYIKWHDSLSVSRQLLIIINIGVFTTMPHVASTCSGQYGDTRWILIRTLCTKWRITQIYALRLVYLSPYMSAPTTSIPISFSKKYPNRVIVRSSLFKFGSGSLCNLQVSVHVPTKPWQCTWLLTKFQITISYLSSCSQNILIVARSRCRWCGSMLMTCTAHFFTLLSNGSIVHFKWNAFTERKNILMVSHHRCHLQTWGFNQSTIRPQHWQKNVIKLVFHTYFLKKFQQGCHPRASLWTAMQAPEQIQPQHGPWKWQI